ncbi:MAG: glutamate mutase L, partial [Acholeplasmataceae bacterium]|nr:glutamate mutase L [Acholeplasmataceae bacterium]
AVLLAAELLSKGFDNEEGLGDIMLADVGGATTDVYSMADGYPKQSNVILSGLEEPFAKRTVEGDLGMRYSAIGILDTMSQAEIAHWKKLDIDIISESKKRHEQIDFISDSDYDYIVDDLLAAKCIDTAVSRHVGTLKGVYTPLGIMYYQVGKDLTAVNYVIGTGGVVISSKDPVKMLKHAAKNEINVMELRPSEPKFLLDKSYVLSAMGLLSIDYPEIALRVMKKRMIEI